MVEAFLGDEPTVDLDEWRRLWREDRPFPIRSERRFWGRLIVVFKRLLRPLVKAPQADLWDRQRTFNLVLISRLSGVAEQLGELREDTAGLGRDLQNVQGEIVGDLRSVQKDYIRDVGELTERVEFLEAFMRDGLKELSQHHDALFARVDQKVDRLRRGR